MIAFPFLNRGFNNNEFLFMMMDSLSTDEIFKRIALVPFFGNVKDLKGIKDDIMIMTEKEWYCPDGVFNTCRILKKWELIFLNASKRGKRVKGDFEHL